MVPLTYTGDPVLYYINGVLQTAPAATAGPPLVISGINIPAGSGAVLIYRAYVNGFAPLGTGETITNTATLAGGGISGSITATETVTYNPASNLTITKAVNPQTVVENGQLTYTFTITNLGAEAVTSGAGTVITDTFLPVLSGLTASLNGTPWPQAGNYTYNATTGLFATVAGQITVPAATYAQDPVTGAWSVTPGTTVLTVTGTV